MASGGDAGVQLREGRTKPPFENDLLGCLPPKSRVSAKGFVVAVGDFPAEVFEQTNRVGFERAFGVWVEVGHTVWATASLRSSSTLISPETSLGRSRSRVFRRLTFLRFKDVDSVHKSTRLCCRNSRTNVLAKE